MTQLRIWDGMARALVVKWSIVSKRSTTAIFREMLAEYLDSPFEGTIADFELNPLQVWVEEKVIDINAPSRLMGLKPDAEVEAVIYPAHWHVYTGDGLKGVGFYADRTLIERLAKQARAEGSVIHDVLCRAIKAYELRRSS